MDMGVGRNLNAVHSIPPPKSYAAHLVALGARIKATVTGASNLPTYTSPWFPPGSTCTNPYAPGTTITVTMTPHAYWASKHPLVQKLYGVTDRGPWMALAESHKGIWIDDEIMVQNMDPPTVMAMRLQYGYTWVPNALQPGIPVPPFLSFPGEPSYDPKDTAGHIIVTVNIGAYPPW